jgi:hypothetical protein
LVFIAKEHILCYCQAIKRALFLNDDRNAMVIRVNLISWRNLFAFERERPASNGNMPVSILVKVDFPEPFSPIRQCTSPL